MKPIRSYLLFMVMVLLTAHGAAGDAPATRAPTSQPTAADLVPVSKLKALIPKEFSSQKRKHITGDPMDWKGEKWTWARGDYVAADGKGYGHVAISDMAGTPKVTANIVDEEKKRLNWAGAQTIKLNERPAIEAVDSQSVSIAVPVKNRFVVEFVFVFSSKEAVEAAVNSFDFAAVEALGK